MIHCSDTLHQRKTCRAAELVVLILATSIISSCAYDGSRTYWATRKMAGSNAPDITKVGTVPFLTLFESLYSPVTAYVDSFEYTGELQASDGHVYMSFIGTRTIWHSLEEDKVLVAVGMIFPFIVDTAVFPFTGVIDTVYVLVAD